MSTRRWLLLAGAVIGVGILAVLYFTFDPSKDGFFPKCIVYRLTGFKCAGCGSQRAIHALLHGDVMGALRNNAVLPIAIIVVALYFWSDFRREKAPRLFNALNSGTAAIIAFVSIVVWTVARNIFGW